ncbi:holin [Enterococcus casseliflavus]|uniref:phage holin family protein n=1 Tax=Enterococcus casseliflavus TaxID=37734 RepID=UPI001C8CD08B|nr:phage holin family protein [Enterococcus casseliflavus]MBX9115905.1 holin [Enterococcus casseliflavus]MBX9126366.1 holin [Enterococcus casseliflavus]
MNVGDFILEEGLVIILVLWIIGYFVKHAGILRTEWIPFLLLGISLVFTPLFLGSYTVEHIVQAVLVTGAAVLGHQFVIQGDHLIHSDDPPDYGDGQSETENKIYGNQDQSKG